MTNILSEQILLTPQEIIAALEEVSHIWKDKYLAKYADALTQTSIYFPDDAYAEACYVGMQMQQDYLQPYLINKYDGFMDFESIMIAISNYRQNVEDPAIFILGSGNISIPLIMNIIIGFLMNQHIYYRASSGNAAAIRVWLDSLNDSELIEDLQNRNQTLAEVLILLRNNIEEISLSHHDEAYKKMLKSFPVQKAYLWGGAEAIENTIQMLDPNVKIFTFGPRTGVMVLETKWWNKLNQSDKIEIANAIYKNILSNDAAMVGSPTTGIILGSRDESENALNEVMQLIQVQENEKIRLARPTLSSASKYRTSMLQWVKFGYKLFSPFESLTKFALGDIKAHQRKNQFFSAPGEYHSSAGSLEFIRFEASELNQAAEYICHLQQEPRYQGLWSVGHLITIMDPNSINQISEHIQNHQESDINLRNNHNIMKAEAIRVVDVRENFGRVPGDRLDGIGLSSSMID